MVRQQLEAVKPEIGDGVVKLGNRPVGVGGDLPLGDMGERLHPVWVCPHGVRDQVVADAQVRRAVQEGPVDLGVVHLGDQLVGRELHVGHGGRHVLLEIVLTVDRPLEATGPGCPEIRLLQRVEPSRHRLVDQAAIVRSGPVAPVGLRAA